MTPSFLAGCDGFREPATGRIMGQGWIYVLVNSSLPGMVKVGRTTREPAERAAELSASTGVPTPFVLAFSQAFANCAEAERLVHYELEKRGLRVAQNREFFRAAPAEIVRVVLDVAGVGAADAPVPPPAATVAALLAEADRHLLGQGEALQDLLEAVRCFRTAAARGSIVAMERLGAIHAVAGRSDRAELRRAMRYLKDGAGRGNYYCYAEMAWLFAAAGSIPNFTKAWDLFFARRADSFNAEAEHGEQRYLKALRKYLAHCLDLKVVPAHTEELAAVAEGLVAFLLATLDEVRDVPDDRHRVSAMLRWVYENVAGARDVTPPRRPAMDWLAGWVSRGRRVAVAAG